MSDQEFHYDVLIVGGGNAACSTAHATLEKTSSVAIIEKSTLRDRGGNSAMTGHTLDGKSTKGIYTPKSNYALEIDKGPFEAWPVRCGITFAFGGLKIEAKTGNVQHVAGRPIPGLYAAGEMVGGLFVGGYGSGSGMMSGATFGRIAGTAAGLAALQS